MSINIRRINLVFISAISLVIGSLTLATPVNAVEPTFDMCPTSTTGVNCIASAEIKLPGAGEFVALSSGTYDGHGLTFPLPTGYVPNHGSNSIYIAAANADAGNAGGISLGQISIRNPNPSVNDLSDWGSDPNITYRLRFNTGSVFPGPALLTMRNAKVKFTSVDSGIQVQLEAQPLEYQAYGNCLICSEERATSEYVGKFQATFMPRMSISQGNLSPSDPSFNSSRAWFGVESNAGDFNRPSWINGSMEVRLMGVHYRLDGVTLNSGTYRVIMNDAFLNNELGLSRQQLLSGGLITQTAEVGAALQNISSEFAEIDSDYVQVKFGEFHYSTRSMVIKPSSTLKSTSIAWSGKKSSAKKSKALSVKVTAKSNKKKAAGSIKVDLTNSSGAIVSTNSAAVRKGSGKVGFSKAFMKTLPSGNYKVNITFQGSGTAKSATKTYSLKIK